MKLKLLVISIILLFPSLVWAACSGSSPTWTCDANSTSAQMNSCIASASVGDTINVGAGTGTWSSTVTIDKGIYLIGAGKTNTTITVNGNPGIKYAPAVGAADNPFRLSGFRFNKNAADANQPTVQFGNSENYPTSSGNNKLTKNRIDNNHFYTSGITSPHIWLYVGTYGVIDNNTFDSNDYAFRSTEGSEWYGTNHGPGWVYWGWTPGTSDAVYIENNTFNFAASADDCLISSQGSHRWVVRYNTVNVNSTSYSFIDAHGNGGTGAEYSSVQISNLYGNKFVAGDHSAQIHGQRGGQSFVFYNDWQTTGDTPVFKVQEEYADSDGPGPATNTITGQPQHVYNSFYFNNRLNTNGALLDIDITDTVGSIPARNTDVYSHNDWVSNGSAGVGCGTTLPGTCTSGKSGFWKTNQSCTNLTDYVGASPTTPISGTLYKCTATNTWTEYYTPYTYPHPLRGESADETAPTVTITTSSGTIYSSSSTVTGTASDAVGVSSCKWRLTSEPDANNGTSCTGTTSWSCSVTGMSSGANTVYVECGDAADNWSTGHYITLTVTDPPTGAKATIGSGAAVTLGSGAVGTLY